MLVSTPFLRALCTAIPLLFAGLTLSWAEEPQLIPIEAFFRGAKYLDPKLSPDGKTLVALTSSQGRYNLVAINLASRTPTVLTGFEAFDVTTYHWTNNDRLVFSLGNRSEASGYSNTNTGGLFAINKDGSESKELWPTVKQTKSSGAKRYRWMRFFKALRQSEASNGDDVLVVSNEHDQFGTDVYRLNTKTARKTLLTLGRPERSGSWLTDWNDHIRVTSVTDKELHTRIYYRNDEDSPWRQLAEFNRGDHTWHPVAFTADNRQLYVLSNVDRNTNALFKYDPETKTLGEKIFGHADVDITDGNLIFNRNTGELLGVRYEADKPGVYWFDEKFERWQHSVDSALTGHFNKLSEDVQGEHVLVASYSDKDPGHYYLFDTKNMRLESVGHVLPSINPEAMAERVPFHYPARDSLSIPAYLTLPKGSGGKSLPMVIIVHGGPYVRGQTWRFDREAQFLASRGYAVIEPDFRGSRGYGLQHFQAGWKQWGLAMQDDLTDAVQWAIKEGIADKDRICIYGASYGGYATMQGLVKTPELYKCGINYVGVTDLLELITSATSDSAQWEGFDTWSGIYIGDSSKERQLLIDNSPMRHADRIKAPVFMAYGADDYRVPIVHGDKMKTALASAGKKFEYMVKAEEGHGYGKLENRLDFYSTMEKFLAQNIGAPAAFARTQ